MYGKRHRIYLVEFENALRKADRQNDNDGNIGLPYWDWTKNPSDGVPQVVFDQFRWPNGLFPDNIKNKPILRRASKSRIVSRLKSANVSDMAVDCLRNAQHWAFASTVMLCICV